MFSCLTTKYPAVTFLKGSHLYTYDIDRTSATEKGWRTVIAIPSTKDRHLNIATRITGTSLSPTRFFPGIPRTQFMLKQLLNGPSSLLNIQTSSILEAQHWMSKKSNPLGICTSPPYTYFEKHFAQISTTAQNLVIKKQNMSTSSHCSFCNNKFLNLNNRGGDFLPQAHPHHVTAFWWRKFWAPLDLLYYCEAESVQLRADFGISEYRR